MSAILSAIGDFITAIFVGNPSATTPVPSWISQVVSSITDNPLITLAVVIPLTGLAVGMLKRLLSARA